MKAKDGLTRRDFLKKSATVTASMVIPSGVFALGSERIKVGLIGCGGRGTGAAVDAAEADPAVVLWAMGDLFQDRLESSKKHLQERLQDRLHVTNERAFVGFDAYKHVIASGVDIVILTAPPGFRPEHLKASVEAGKHVFMENPLRWTLLAFVR